ncbi:MAG: tRNA-dihydrouridine synthase [Candidatus Saccharibacteria bacterium]
MKNIWKKLPKPFFALAPMEAVTDIVFRQTIKKAARPDLFFTEFVNASSFCNPKGVKSTRDRLKFIKNEKPIIVQIWGNKPEQFEQMSKSLAKMGFSGIDINMGCPDKSVVKNGSGSGLIRTPELACELIRSAKRSELPISVKTRLGVMKVDEWHDWIKLLLEQDIVNLTVHLRTRKEMTKVPAHHELIPEIIKLRDEIAPQTLITINGDIRDRQHGEELAKKYNIDGIMIGRGIFSNPFAFEKRNKIHSQKNLIKLLKTQLKLHDKYGKNSPRKYDPLKRYFKIYIRDFPGASEARDKLMHTKNTEEAREIIGKL